MIINNLAFVIGDLIWRVQPDLLIELGTSGGGSAWYWAHIMSGYNTQAKVLTMDPASGGLTGTPLKSWNGPSVRNFCPHCDHPTSRPEWREMVRYVRSVPASDEAIEIARAAAAEATVVMVIEDSIHLENVVYENLKAYAGFVTPDSYFIVQDTRLGGPAKALDRFLAEPGGADHFERDTSAQYYTYSQHIGGFLRRAPSTPLSA